MTHVLVRLIILVSYQMLWWSLMTLNSYTVRQAFSLRVCPRSIPNFKNLSIGRILEGELSGKSNVDENIAFKQKRGEENNVMSLLKTNACSVLHVLAYAVRLARLYVKQSIAFLCMWNTGLSFRNIQLVYPHINFSRWLCWWELILVRLDLYIPTEEQLTLPEDPKIFTGHRNN